MKNTYSILLVCVTLLAFLLRSWANNSLPAILNRDEAALAYNAVLLRETGQDEWGRSWPVGLESFGDYKLIGYPLLLIPFLGLFGEADWVIRLPSILAGTALVPLAYVFVKQLGFKKQAALMMALLIAVSPVSIFYSRMAYEANVALTLLVAALVTLHQLAKQYSWRRLALLLSLLLFASLTYNTPWLLLPVAAGYTFLIFPKKQWREKWAVLVGLGVVFLLGLWLLQPVITQKGNISIFSDETIRSEWLEARSQLPTQWQPVIGHRFIYWGYVITQNFLASFSPQFLVTQGGSHPWHTVPETGHVLAITYGLGLIGIVHAGAEIITHRKRFERIRIPLVILWLLFASLAPAVITVDAPHATRSLLFFFMFQLLAVMGLVFLIQKYPRFQQCIWGVCLAGIIISASWYTYQLFVIFPSQQRAYLPGFDTLIQQIEKEHPTKNIAVVDPAGHHYILLAWYLKVPPATYFQTVVRQQPDQIGFRYGERLGRYHFIAHPTDRSDQEPILIQWVPDAQAWQVKYYGE